MKLKVMLLTLFAAMTTSAMACTNFLVGKKASADGSAFISYSADSYGFYGKMQHWAAGRHEAGAMRRIFDGDSGKYLGDIPEAAETYSVIGQINEYQVAITETTFGGREELWRNPGIIDYTTLMTLGLQRAKTAREAIKVMTELVAKYGYASEGESFSIADPNEVWVMEMIGKGDAGKDAVWVAVRIPDDCIAAHANQSRIHRFDLKDKQNVLYAKDVITFARQQGYFNGKDADFDFAAAYAPADFSTQRICDARAWSFFNKFVDGMERYLPYVDGKHIGDPNVEVMPLYFKPSHKLSVLDVMNAMRDHYEGTPLDITHDAGAGIYDAPYRPTPLFFEADGKKYFNERPISTQQTAYTVVAQLRSWLPNAIGGVLWYGNDDANMVAYTPVYCCATRVPAPYQMNEKQNATTFSWESAFWVCNWVSNMTYPRYAQLFPSVKAVRDELQQKYLDHQKTIEDQAAALIARYPAEAKELLTQHTCDCADDMLARWKQLGEYLIVKYNDQAIKPEKDGEFELTPEGLPVAPERPGYSDAYKKVIARETGERYVVPE
ncbi:MAG: C69 family dipeptidase [Bacteroidales bacterium]|nr:C69 family dipeptidase [Candidatus Equimonas enterica]